MKANPFLEYVVYDVFGENEPITFRAMMGAHILYYEGKAFALVEDDELYFKGSKELEDWYMKNGSKKFTYTKLVRRTGTGGERKDAHLYYFRVPQEVYENKEELYEWLGYALSVAKLPKKRK